MRWHSLSSGEWLRAVLVGLGVSLLTAAVMVTLLKTGVSPLPKPLGLAFCAGGAASRRAAAGRLAFHAAWVTTWSVIYVGLFRDDLTFLRALWLAIGLWLLVLVAFFPVVGWGFFGLAVGPKVIVASAIPHLLFALFVWALSRWTFAPRAMTSSQRRSAA